MTRSTTLANTSLVAASAMAASQQLLRLAAAARRQRLAADFGHDAGGRHAANTVSWYTGEAGAVRIPHAAPPSAGRSVDHRAVWRARQRAGASALQLQNMAVYAAVTTTATDPNANDQITALSQRVDAKSVAAAGRADHSGHPGGFRRRANRDEGRERSAGADQVDDADHAGLDRGHLARTKSRPRFWRCRPACRRRIKRRRCCIRSAC